MNNKVFQKNNIKFSFINPNDKEKMERLLKIVIIEKINSNNYQLNIK